MLPLVTYYAQLKPPLTLSHDVPMAQVILVPLASASAEWVILKRHFTQYQNSALQDYVEVGVMLTRSYIIPASSPANCQMWICAIGCTVACSANHHYGIYTH